jgi:hypothetical protein
VCDLSLQVFRPKRTRLLTFLPERLSPFALPAPNESIWLSFQSTVNINSTDTSATTLRQLEPFTGSAARAAVRASGQPGWLETISCAPPRPAVNPVGMTCAPPPAGPAAATAGIGDSANWGECHLKLEWVVPSG